MAAGLNELSSTSALAKCLASAAWPTSVFQVYGMETNTFVQLRIGLGFVVCHGVATGRLNLGAIGPQCTQLHEAGWAWAS